MTWRLWTILRFIIEKIISQLKNYKKKIVLYWRILSLYILIRILYVFNLKEKYFNYNSKPNYLIQNSNIEYKELDFLYKKNIYKNKIPKTLLYQILRRFSRKSRQYSLKLVINSPKKLHTILEKTQNFIAIMFINALEFLCNMFLTCQCLMLNLLYYIPKSSWMLYINNRYIIILRFL